MLLLLNCAASKVFLKKSGNVDITFFMFYPDLAAVDQNYHR